MFSGLADKLSAVFDKLTKRGILTESAVDETMREIKIALIEADVALPVVKDFIASVREKAIGEQIVKSVSPAQMVVKIVNDALVDMLGESKPLNLAPRQQNVILVVGLQGSGKTTSSAKLAKRLQELNPEEFKKLTVGELTEAEKSDVIMGMCSKFTMEDINHFIHANRRKDEHDFIPGVPFFMSKETQTKLEGFLAQQNTSLAYLTHFEHFADGQEMAIQEIKILAQRSRGCELSVIEQEAQKFLSGRGGWRDMPHQDLKILGLMDHEDAVIIDEIRKNPDRFFALLKETSNPARYAEQFLSLYARSEEAAKGNADICARLGKLAKPQTKNSSAAQKQPTPRDGRNTLARRGLSKILDLTQKLPPTQNRKWVKETLVKGYRFFYPKRGSNR